MASTDVILNHLFLLVFSNVILVLINTITITLLMSFGHHRHHQCHRRHRHLYGDHHQVALNVLLAAGFYLNLSWINTTLPLASDIHDCVF